MNDEPVFLTVDDVLALHVDQIREFGGSEGLRDQIGLGSAVAQASATYGGKYLHAGLFDMAAVMRSTSPGIIRSSTATSAPP
jgi:death on curing protein